MEQEIFILPAIIEILKLLALVSALVVAILGAVKLNYKVYSSAWYLPVMILLGIGAGVLVRTVFHGDHTAVGFVAAFPLATALFFKYALKGKYQSPITFAAPAVVGVLLLFIYPLLFDVYLAFTHLNLNSLGDWIETGKVEFYGFKNFVNVVSRQGMESQETFWLIFGRTILWTVINIVFHFTFGLCLALLLNQKIKFVPIYRALLCLPWAAPGLILVLSWRGEFHSQYGFVNQLIALCLKPFGCTEANGCWVPIEWWTDPKALFASICIVNIWLGIPFHAVTSLSGLQAIPMSYYEASSIDGASKWQQFKNITLPLLKPVVVPAIILDMIWTFNNVMVVYLMTAQRGGSQGADILVSDLYRQSFTFNNYSFAAAYSMVIFFILGGLSLIWLKFSKISEMPGR